ncbi:MAG: hypothetical protein K2X66_16210 [Cyanobacteria bacterium]|nr:hypothetical protein [Cyanobacteriota bacterium]
MVNPTPPTGSMPPLKLRPAPRSGPFAPSYPPGYSFLRPYFVGPLSPREAAIKQSIDDGAAERYNDYLNQHQPPRNSWGNAGNAPWQRP